MGLPVSTSGGEAFSWSLIVEKEKTASEKSHLPPLVGYRDELSNFIRDFKSIVDFIKQYSFLGL